MARENDIALIPAHLLMPIAMGAFNRSQAEEAVAAVGKVEINIGDGLTLLHMAAQGNLLDVAEYLIEAGHPLNPRTHPVQETPLDQAAWRGARCVAELLVTKGADINCQTAGGYTPLHRCAFYGHSGLASVLVLMGASLAVKDENGDIPYDCAVAQGHDHIARLIKPHYDREGRLIEMYARNNPAHPEHRPEATTALLQLSALEKALSRQH